MCMETWDAYRVRSMRNIPMTIGRVDCPIKRCSKPKLCVSDQVAGNVPTTPNVTLKPRLPCHEEQQPPDHEGRRQVVERVQHLLLLLRLGNGMKARICLVEKILADR